MNIKRLISNFLLINTREIPVNKFMLFLLQIALMSLFTFILYYYSFNHDWKRFISLIAMFIIMKLILEVSILLTNLVKKSNYSISDLTHSYNLNSQYKKSSYLLGLFLVIFISIQVFSYKSFDNYMDEQLSTNGLYIEAEVIDIYWHKSKKKKNTGYYADFYYQVENEKYYHQTKLDMGIEINGDYANFSSLKIKYLPKLPNKHSVEFIKE